MNEIIKKIRKSLAAGADEKIKIGAQRFFKEKVNYYGLTPVAFAATGFACPPSADNFIYGFTPVVLRRKNKSSTMKINHEEVVATLHMAGREGDEHILFGQNDRNYNPNINCKV